MNISRRDKGQAMLRRRDQIKCLFTLARLNGLAHFLRPMSNLLGFIRGFRARREMRKDRRYWGQVLARTFKTKQTTKNKYNFCPYHTFATLKSVSVQLNGNTLNVKNTAGMTNFGDENRALP